MLKIAILVREESTLRCTGHGCLRSFFDRAESFAGFCGTDVQLTGFFHSGGDLDSKTLASRASYGKLSLQHRM